LEVFEFLGKIFNERSFLAQEQFREELMMMKFCSSVVVCSKAIDKSHLPQMQMFTTFPCEPIFPCEISFVDTHVNARESGIIACQACSHLQSASKNVQCPGNYLNLKTNS
jgi:hypothetical protein